MPWIRLKYKEAQNLCKKCFFLTEIAEGKNKDTFIYTIYLILEKLNYSARI